jgi:hypothetical protein
MYFIKDKKYTWIQRKVATVLRPLWAWNRGQLVVHRTDSEQEVQNRRLSPFLDTLQLPLTTPPTTPLYYSALQSQLPITAEDPPTKSTTTTVNTKVVSAFRAENLEKYHFENC